MFWFSIGALVAMFCSFFITNTIIQTIIFLVVSTILLFATLSLLPNLLIIDYSNNYKFYKISK